MSLDFTGGNDDRILVTDDASFASQAAFSVLYWIRRESGANNRRWLRKSANRDISDGFNNNDDVYFGVERATTIAQLTTDENFATGVWRLIAFTYDETDGPRVFHGTRTAVAVEASYVTRTVGAGATTGDAGDLEIMNRQPSRSVDGQLAMFHWVNKRLTLGEILQQQFRPQPIAGSRILLFPGWDGTGTQRDYTGRGNNGTVTGATLSSFDPGIVPGWVSPAGTPYIVPATSGLVPIAMASYQRRRQWSGGA